MTEGTGATTFSTLTAPRIWKHHRAACREVPARRDGSMIGKEPRASAAS
jgi:hypothetical protein